jgi:transposase-like protein
MKTQLTKPARSKASYTKEYKQEALELWRASGRSAAKVAAELGIRPPLLYTVGRTRSGRSTRPTAEPSQDTAWKNWRQKTAACARRTPSSWSSVKF